MIPIPKLGMAIHNNNRPNADNPSGFDLFRGTMVTDAKSHSFSRNPTKLGLGTCEYCVSAMVSSVKEGSSRPAHLARDPGILARCLRIQPAEKQRGSAKTAGLIAAEAATGD